MGKERVKKLGKDSNTVIALTSIRPLMGIVKFLFILGRKKEDVSMNFHTKGLEQDILS